MIRRRRCIGLRIAVVLGVILGVTVRDDLVVLAFVAAGVLVALVAWLVDCRGSRRPASSRASR